ncbi:ubiquitin-conjugating enzyme [Plasmodium falciparum IGH-CR14]|uniref:Ubiquitin-conjugating enzyme n=1 Tax=Plasmodium falciparum IGH-CR14 TaxID=580059 RepID=A0A0L1I458_PLAFA|nr:ubiquitin-conjugating enzyme [Plasmodium falciparum IGH-CR14]
MFSKRKIIKKNIKKSFEDNDEEEQIDKLNAHTNYKNEKEFIDTHDDIYQLKFKETNQDNNATFSASQNVKNNYLNMKEIKEKEEEKKNVQNGQNEYGLTCTFIQSNDEKKKEEKIIKKKSNKMSCIERKKNEEEKRVNKMNTSFHIYSEDDNDSYITLKKKKKKKSSSVKMYKEEKNNKIDNIHNNNYNNSDNIFKENQSSDNETFNNAYNNLSIYNSTQGEKHIYNKDHMKIKKDKNLSYNNHNIKKNEIYLSEDNHTNYGDHTSDNDEENDNKDIIYDDTKFYVNDSTSYKLKQRNISSYEVGNDYSNNDNENVVNLGSDNSGVVSKGLKDNNQIFNNSEDVFIIDDKCDNYQSININLQDEYDDKDNDEEKKLIERIKLKKNILRKKKEINNINYNNNDNNLFLDDDYDDNFLFPMEKKNFFFEIKKNKNVTYEDDLDVDDMYNYETINEMKNRILIKKNRNEEIKNLYEERNIEENVVDTNDLNIDNNYEDYDLYEDEKINQIVDNKMLVELKKQNDFLYDSKKKKKKKEEEEEEEEENKRERVKDKDLCFKEDNINAYIKSNNNEPKEEEHVKNKEYSDDDLFSLSREKDKELYSLDNNNYYNDKNKLLFEKIQNAYKNKGVCNLEIIKMYEHIQNLFSEYKNKIQESNEIKELENSNQVEYNKYEIICKKGKKEIIICRVFLQFLQILINLICEKYEPVEDALNGLYKLESTFHLIYHNLKLYIYKEYYEKYKLTFINDYIFNSKYYKNLKEKKKKIQLQYLIDNNIIQNNGLNDNVTQINEYNILNEICDVKNMNNSEFYYMFDGFSSNYSTDTLSSTSLLLENDLNGDNKNFIQRKENKDILKSDALKSDALKSDELKSDALKNDMSKKNLDKQKYFQTLKMKDLKKKFLFSINNIFKNVNMYFFNFKNVIKYFGLLKLYNYHFYVNNKCSSYFDDVLFFFVKCELLYWDPLYQFFMSKKKKKRILNYFDEDINSSSSMKKNESNKNNLNILDSNKMDNNDKHFNIDEDNKKFFSLYSSPSPQYDNDEKNIYNNTNERTIEYDMDMSGSSSSSNFSLSHTSSCNENNLNNENILDREEENVKKICSNIFKNKLFKKKKYKLRKTFFHNPSIKSFEWYKFMDELILIYDNIEEEKDILKKLYEHIFNKKIYELINVWNPLSLKQSFHLSRIINDFILYNDNINELRDKIKDKIQTYITTFLQCYKNITSQKKKNIFLMRCLKFLKSMKNILQLLCNEELYDIVKNVFNNYVLPNCDDGNKLHNLIVLKIIQVIHSLDNIPKEDSFFHKTTEIMSKISDCLKTGYFDMLKVENGCMIK